MIPTDYPIMLRPARLARLLDVTERTVANLPIGRIKPSARVTLYRMDMIDRLLNHDVPNRIRLDTKPTIRQTATLLDAGTSLVRTLITTGLLTVDRHEPRLLRIEPRSLLTLMGGPVRHPSIISQPIDEPFTTPLVRTYIRADSESRSVSASAAVSKRREEPERVQQVRCASRM